MTFFKLPTPKQLGFSNNELSYDGWLALVKERHPIKYFFLRSLPDVFKMAVRSIEQIHYWTLSHLLPSRKFHMLDLRQPNEYRWGYVDVPKRMLFAIFNLLAVYVEEEDPYIISDEEVEADPMLADQQFITNEARDIHYWWTVERPAKSKEIDAMLHQWLSLVESGKEEDKNTKILYANYSRYRCAEEQKVDEQVMRVMKIRKSLWT